MPEDNSCISKLSQNGDSLSRLVTTTLSVEYLLIRPQKRFIKNHIDSWRNQQFSLKPGIVYKYYLIAENCSTCLKKIECNMCDLIGLNSCISHDELQSSHIRRDDGDVHSVANILGQIGHTP